LSKKEELFQEAERLYVYEQVKLVRIASKLNLNYKTILAWKEEGDWSEKRFQLIKAKQLFHQDLYVFARKLMHEIEESMENGIEPSQSKMLTFTRSLSLLLKVKDYEDKVAKVESRKTKAPLAEDIIRIMEEALGIKSQNSSDEFNRDMKGLGEDELEHQD